MHETDIADIKAKYFFDTKGLSIAEKIRQELGNNALKETKDSGKQLKHEEDKIIWSMTTTCIFSFTTAWELVRQRDISSMLDKLCWHPNMPPKISFSYGKW